MLRRILVATILGLACFAFSVSAAHGQGTQNSQGDQNQDGQGQNEQGNARSVPEFDPLTVGAVAAVLAGGGVLVARRRKS